MKGGFLNLRSIQCHLQLLVFFVTTAIANPDCNRTLPIGTDLSFYEGQETIRVTMGEHFSILCCAQLYETIEWYRDEISPLTIINETNSSPMNCSYCLSQHAFRFLEGGQVLKVNEITKYHKGKYVCVIKNGTRSEVLEQNVEINLRNNADKLKNTTKTKTCSHTNMKTYIGANLTLCCAFMGLDKEKVHIEWETTINNAPVKLISTDTAMVGHTTLITEVSYSEIDKEHYFVTEVKSYLKIYNVTIETFGSYVVTSWLMENGNQGNCTFVVSEDIVYDSSNVVVTVIISMAMSFALVTCMATLIVSVYIWKRYNMTIWLLVSDMLPFYDELEKDMYDAFISHSDTDEDREFAVQVLRPLLEKHNYTTCIDVINFPAGGIRFDDGIAAVVRSRRCILVLSPDYVNNVHCRYELHAALQDMQNIRSRCLKIIPITFKETSKENLNRSKHLRRVLFAVRKLKWTPENVEDFEKKLISRIAPANSNLGSVRQSAMEGDGKDSFDVGYSKTFNNNHFNRFHNPTKGLYKEFPTIYDEDPSFPIN